ncbi:RalA-binding protein, putative [Entamoeba invadens IP1]|uniref:RalA-binding protein, putative n=1 Tax=Entamoeba invadens IP1 TaxID=370355 RepID=L7FL72_ENTIV|nr:RalA-binding protein, putative [Entamoeba invadens IP1]ELP86357.1 RalA-binding protein, putative [Entamoeba invadens IP1]|eukprot:XP_004185703.1 RalA-binding protein, putative [Entamoeba invadens IP1]
MQNKLISNTLHEQIPMYPDVVTAFIDQIKKFREFLDSYGKRILVPLGFYNMMLRTKQPNYNLPEYEIDSIIPSYQIIVDLNEDFIGVLNDAVDAARSAQLEISEKDVIPCETIVFDQILDSLFAITKRISRTYTLYAIDYPFALTKNTFLEKNHSQYFGQTRRIQKASEAMGYSLEQLLEGIMKFPMTLYIAFKRIFDGIPSIYKRWADMYKVLMSIKKTSEKTEDTLNDIREHLIVSQAKIDINFNGGIATEELYDENRRLIKFVDGEVTDIQTFDYDGSPMEQSLFATKENKEVRFYIFNDTLFMTTQPKRSIFSVITHSSLKGILFKKKFALTQCTVKEKPDNRELEQYCCDLIEDTPQKTFLTIKFEKDPDLQQFIQNFSSAKLAFLKTQCFGINPKEFVSKVKSEKGRLTPRFFNYCTNIIATRGIMEEGIFRISSEQKNINRLISRIDQGDCYFEIINPHDAANLIKTYLRTLPQSIAGDKLDDFIDAIASKEPIEETKKVFETMDESNVAVMYIFTKLLIVVESKKEINKMGIDNLCIVVAPTFFWKKGEMQRQNGFEIVQFMMQHQEVFDVYKEKVNAEIQKDQDRMKKEEELYQETMQIAFEKHCEEEKKRIQITDEKPTMTIDEFKKAKLLELLEKERAEKAALNEKKRLEREVKEKEEEEKRKVLEAEREKERLEAVERQKEIDRLENEEARAKLAREEKRAQIDAELAAMEKKDKETALENERKLKEAELKLVEEKLRQKEAEMKAQEEKRANAAKVVGMCAVCNTEVYNTEDSINAGKRLVHERCFVCKKCKVPIEGRFAWKDDVGGFVCADCVAKANASAGVPSDKTCGKCGKEIEGKMLKAMGKFWHPECFVCSMCGGKISGGFGNLDGKPICKECNAKL